MSPAGHAELACLALSLLLIMRSHARTRILLACTNGFIKVMRSAAVCEGQGSDKAESAFPSQLWRRKTVPERRKTCMITIFESVAVNGGPFDGSWVL